VSSPAFSVNTVYHGVWFIWLNLSSKSYGKFHYLRQAGYVIVIVCVFVYLSVSNFEQKLPNGFALNIFRAGWQWASEQIIKFWC